MTRAVEVRWEFKAADCWVGLYWEYRPHPCDFDVCYNNRIHVWVCLVPMLPLHISWLVRSEKPEQRSARVRAARGRYAHRGATTEEFLRDKHEHG